MVQRITGLTINLKLTVGKRRLVGPWIASKCLSCEFSFAESLSPREFDICIPKVCATSAVPTDASGPVINDPIAIVVETGRDIVWRRRIELEDCTQLNSMG